MSERLGFREVLAMGIGGVVGGGIFAVLGVAARIAGNAAFISYFLSGLIALASGYSYVRMTSHLEEDGGSFTFLEHYVSNKNIAGMVSWVLIVGYIGTMAMYAYAFGSFSARMLGIGAHTVVRGLISIGILGLFVGVNLIGVQKTGESEDLLVYGKVAILLLFGGAGLWALLSGPGPGLLPGGLFNRGPVSPIVGIGTIFVSFQGWELLTYEYSEMEGGTETLKRGVMWTIGISTLLYVMTAILTTSLVPTPMIIKHKETVLAFAAAKIFKSHIMRDLAGILVSVAALFSTASAINATLFGTARFTHKMATENELPELFSFRNKKDIPSRSLIIIGLITALFTYLGTLEGITTFASLSFVMIFGTVNYVCLRDPDVDVNGIVPLTGLLGTASVLILEVWHLWTTEFHMLVFITGIFGVLFLLEFLYFEREEIEEEVATEVQKVEEEVEEELGEEDQ
ncbi:MAG: APC family permease [Candidatus Nanohaloarchaea archaeon]